MTIKVDLQNALAHDELKHHLPSTSEIEQWLNVAIALIRSEGSNDTQTVMQHQHLEQVQTKRFEVTLRFVDALESRQLNNDYRQKNKPTNVLSFEFEAPEHIEMAFLGDLVICASVVEQEAMEQNKKPIDHWAHLCVHGLLHLLGYDHEHEHDAKEMESLEKKILFKLNIDDPYQDH